MLYIAQCDANKVYQSALAIYTSTGNSNVIAEVVGVATQSGYVYVRARLNDDLTQHFTITKISPKYGSNSDVSLLGSEVKRLAESVNSVVGSINDTVQQKVNEALDSNIEQKSLTLRQRKLLRLQQVLSSLMLLKQLQTVKYQVLPSLILKLRSCQLSSSDHGYNFAPFTQNNVVSFDDYQYVILVDENRNPIVLQRYKLGSWTSYNLANVAITHLLRQMFPMDTIISQWVLQNGFILIAGNHHNNTCRCVISQNPHDIQSWSKISFHHLLR